MSEEKKNRHEQAEAKQELTGAKSVEKKEQPQDPREQGTAPEPPQAREEKQPAPAGDKAQPEQERQSRAEKTGDSQTEKLARERSAKPGPGARESTAAQVDANNTQRPPSKHPNQVGEGKRPAPRPRPAAARQPEPPPEPSPKQPWMDELVAAVKEACGQDAVEEGLINRLSKDLPTLVVPKDKLQQVARFLRDDPRYRFVILSDIAGVDYTTHMEAVYQLVSLEKRENLCIKVKTERDNPVIPSLTSLWTGANWMEREAYDLLGIRFEGHPDLRRIMLPEDWVGHPLRKDYDPYDVEV